MSVMHPVVTILWYVLFILCNMDVYNYEQWFRYASYYFKFFSCFSIARYRSTVLAGYSQKRREDKVNLSARGRLYCIHYVEMLDGFTVELVKGSFLDKLLRREYRMAEIVIELERQLNGGNTFLEAYFAFSQRELSSADWKKRTDLAAQEKIPCRSFNVNPGDFSCSKGVLTCQWCPIHREKVCLWNIPEHCHFFSLPWRATITWLKCRYLSLWVEGRRLQNWW